MVSFNALLSVITLAVCTQAAIVNKRAITNLPANGKFDYQIGGPYTPASDVKVVDRDHSQSPVAKLYNICYVNAFQTQPEEADFWKNQHSDLLLKTSSGALFEDLPDWPGEYFLDTSTAAKRTAIATIVNGWISDCATKGFQAVEPDNLDSYTRSKGKLTQQNNLDLAKLLATHAHSLNLAIAQKNAAELESVGKDTVGFDFAIAEECQVSDECDEYSDAYGNEWLEIEYTDNGLGNFTNACNARRSQVSVILRDRQVVPSSNKAEYHYEEC